MELLSLVRTTYFPSTFTFVLILYIFIIDQKGKNVNSWQQIRDNDYAY